MDQDLDRGEDSNSSRVEIGILEADRMQGTPLVPHIQEKIYHLARPTR